MMGRKICCSNWLLMPMFQVNHFGRRLWVSGFPLEFDSKIMIWTLSIQFLNLWDLWVIALKKDRSLQTSLFQRTFNKLFFHRTHSWIYNPSSDHRTLAERSIHRRIEKPLMLYHWTFRRRNRNRTHWAKFNLNRLNSLTLLFSHLRLLNW